MPEKELGQHGGNRRSGNPHIQNQHEQKIQYNIADRRNGHRSQRRPAVPYGPQNCRRGIIEDGGRNTRVNKAQIQKGQPPDLLRRSHPRKHSRKRRLAQRSEKDGGGSGKENGLKHCPAKFPFLPGSKFLGNDHRETLGQSLHRAEHQKGQPFRRSQRCQRIHAKRLAHHQRIHEGI